MAGTAREAAYRIHVAGSLDPRLAEWFEGLTAEHRPDGGSVLLTPPLDQAALRGVPSALFNLNVRVIAVLPREWQGGEAPDG
jgi:hypothetical protein